MNQVKFSPNGYNNNSNTANKIAATNSERKYFANKMLEKERKNRGKKNTNHKTHIHKHTFKNDEDLFLP